LLLTITAGWGPVPRYLFSQRTVGNSVAPDQAA